MRRWFGALQIGALVTVLSTGIAHASLNGFEPARVDLSAQLFARLFGESTDRIASFSAVGGDSLAETPLRDLAFRVDISPESVIASNPLVRLPVLSASLFRTPGFAAPIVNLSDAAFAPQPIKASIAVLGEQLRVPTVEYYQSSAPIPTDAPATHRFDLSGLQQSASQPMDYAPTSFNANTPLSQHDAGLQVPVHVGNVHFSPHAEAGLSQDSQASSNDRSLGAGATIDVRAGRRNLGVDLSSQLEHVMLNAPQYSTPNGNTAPTMGLTGGNLPVFVPAYADVSAHMLSTGVTVPVSRSLTANLQYDTQHLMGAYGLPGVTNLDASNTIFGAQLTFQLPRGTSAISLSARQYHFQDNLVPSNAVTQTNTNLNFIVKF